MMNLGWQKVLVKRNWPGFVLPEHSDPNKMIQGGIVRAYKQLKPAGNWALIIKTVLFIWIPILLCSAVLAADPSQQAGAISNNDQIQIVADKFITNKEEKFAEFIGNVRASQGAFVITSERLRIYYQTASKSAGDQTGGPESIKQVVASGNVQLATGKYTAEAERVEYDLENQIIVLTGENSILKSSQNSLTGSKITVHRQTGEMKVESNPQKRVKAVFYPDKKSEEKE